MPVLEVLGRVAEPQGSEAGAELGAQGSVLRTGGTEDGAPHGSDGATGLGTEPGETGRHSGQGIRTQE